MDPLSLIAVSAAMGGATGKFVEKAWDSAEKWLTSYFHNHRPNAQSQATANSLDFLTQLANRVHQLETSEKVSVSKISDAMDTPQFSILLQNAIYTSAVTSDSNKHILSRLVSDSLMQEPESVLTLTSKIACDTLTLLSAMQLKLLAILTNIMYLNPNNFHQNLADGIITMEFIRTWKLARLMLFNGYEFRAIDFDHLESTACLKTTYLENREAGSTLTYNGVVIDFAQLEDKHLGAQIVHLWRYSTLNGINLTLVGKVLGAYTTDALTGQETGFINWD